MTKRNKESNGIQDKETVEKLKMEEQEEGNQIEIERDESKEEQKTELGSKEVEDLTEQNNQLKDQLLRKVADFENYKRRIENDQLNFVKYAGESLILKILPIYDDLRRSLEHSDSAGDSLQKGLKLVYDKFSKVLQEEGVEKIEAKGKEFDFNLHEALMQREVEGVPAHTVIEEVEPGYMYKDKVIRHAKVIVSQESTTSPESE